MIINANALHIPLADKSVQCIVTSPPYWGLRNYGILGQLGLERTPEEYIANMVAVFRECWRVLRDDGTLWLNVGDSYGTKGSDWSMWKGGQTYKDRDKFKGVEISTNLKPKDLVGIPWRLAFALQQPYYTGTIRNEADRIWLAAIVDGEGCMFIHKRKVGQDNGSGYLRKHDTYGAGLEVANTHLSIVERCQQITGKGSICHQDKESKTKNRNQRLYRWNMRSNECRDIIREIYPYLVAKKHEARLVLGCPSSGEQAERAHAGLIALHNGFEVDIDFKEPESMYEPGWYLRSDIIWAKNNPMPESVTDRPTKSHEYLFLLAKQERYYYDQEAIREGLSETTLNDPRMNDMGRTYNGKGRAAYGETGKANGSMEAWSLNPAGRNRRTVWTIPTAPYKGAHFATFPPALVEPCIKAGTSERGACPKCGKGWKRITNQDGYIKAGHGGGNGKQAMINNLSSSSSLQPDGMKRNMVTTGWQPACNCDAGDPIPCLVFDPFVGSGTTVKVAYDLGRRGVGLDLSLDYLDEQARKRIHNGHTARLF